MLGDCLLNAEPGAPTTIRFGEKGILRAAIIVETPGCHGAYTHKSPSATRIAARIASELAAIDDLPVSMDPAVGRAFDEASAEIDRVHVVGAAASSSGSRLNIGVVRGGVKVNMLPGDMQARVRCAHPRGRDRGEGHGCMRQIVTSIAGARLEVMGFTEPNWSDPDTRWSTICGRACSDPAASHLRHHLAWRQRIHGYGV